MFVFFRKNNRRGVFRAHYDPRNVKVDLIFNKKIREKLINVLASFPHPLSSFSS
jgi:hypothetical protein